MKTPEEYIREFIQPQVLSITSITRMAYQIQKDSYNQAIEDSVKSLQNYEMIWGNGAIVPSNQFEREILKLKIK